MYKTKPMSTEKQISTINNRLIKSSGKIATKNASEHDISFQHAILCQTCLPYRDPGDHVLEWERRQGHALLVIQANKAYDPKLNARVQIGLPYGPKARLILAHINTQAIKTQSRHIDVGDSMTRFVRRLGLSTDGRTIRTIQEQIRRLSVAMITMAYADDRHYVQQNSAIIERINVWFDKDSNQRVLWDSTVELGEKYFLSLVEHAVPLDERALASLSHTAMGLDVYSWLAQRLHRIEPGKPQFVAWANLKDQFGHDVKQMKNFRKNFLVALNSVLTQYRDANIEIIGAKGINLKHSRPPIRKNILTV